MSAQDDQDWATEAGGEARGLRLLSANADKVAGCSSPTCPPPNCSNTQLILSTFGRLPIMSDDGLAFSKSPQQRHGLPLDPVEAKKRIATGRGHPEPGGSSGVHPLCVM